MRVGSGGEISKATVTELVDDDALTLGAALAFYTALGMSPLLVLLLWLTTFLGEGTRQQVVAQIQGAVGSEGGQVVRAIVENATAMPQLGNLAGIASLAMLLFSVGALGMAAASAAITRQMTVSLLRSSAAAIARTRDEELHAAGGQC